MVQFFVNIEVLFFKIKNSTICWSAAGSEVSAI
jgi:hypothetical protein